jgi:transcriptional regulator with XRE-family HTH domain
MHASQREIPLITRRLKKLRAAAGLTQQELAVKAGLSIAVVCQVEQGRKADPLVSTVQALAAGLGVDCVALIGEATRKTPGKRPRARLR